MVTIEDILAQCLRDMEKGDTVADCLARYPGRREELEPLLQTARHVSRLPDVALSPDFRRNARTRLLERLETIGSSRPIADEGQRPRLPRMMDRLRQWSSFTSPLRRFAVPVVVAIAILLLLGTVGLGVVQASSTSLPGDPLYGVKRAGERAQLLLSLGDIRDARLKLSQARERVEEAARLAELGRTADVRVAMKGYVRAVGSASRSLERRGERGSDTQALSEEMREQLAEHERELNRIQQRVGDDAQPAIQRALAASREAQTGVFGPPPTESPTSPTAASATPSDTPATVRNETEQPTATSSPSETDEPAEEGEPSKSPEPAEQTNTPAPPGQTKTPEPPGQTKTPQPPGKTRTPEPPGQTSTPKPPGQTKTPQPPGQTKTPQPPGLTKTPQPPEPTDTPAPSVQTDTPNPPGLTRTPNPPGQTRTPGRP